MKVPMYDQFGMLAAEWDVPDEIMGIAEILKKWLEAQPTPALLHGVGVVKDHLPFSLTDENPLKATAGKPFLSLKMAKIFSPVLWVKYPDGWKLVGAREHLASGNASVDEDYSAIPVVMPPKN